METLKRAAEDLDKSYDLNPATSLSKVDCSLPIQNLFPVLHKEWFNQVEFALPPSMSYPHSQS